MSDNEIEGGKDKGKDKGEKKEKKDDKKDDKKEGEKDEKGEKKEGTEGEKDEKGEGEKDEKGDKKEGDCKPGAYCAAKPAGEKLIEIGDLGKKLDNAAADLMDKGIKKLMGAIVSPVKCVQLVATDLPNVIENFIKGIGNSTSGAIDKITNSINGLFAELGGREIKGYPDLFGPFETAYAVLIINIQNIINKIALGANANQILADPNMDSKRLLDKMMRTSTRYKDAVKEAEFQGIFKEWMSNYINALLTTLDIAQPEIDRINKKIKDIIEGMGDNIGESISHSLVNVIKAVVSNIPGVGGIVSALTSADQLGQEILKLCEPPIVKGAGIVLPVVNGVHNQIEKTKCQINKLASKVEPIFHKFSGGGGISGAKNGRTRKISGANISNGTSTQKKINNSTRRIQYMLGRFGTRRRNLIMNKRKTRRI
jgi:hypothetical protein